MRADIRVDDMNGVPNGTGRNAYRIVQEGLTNARKHAAGAPVDLLLEGAPGAAGLSERAALANGRLEHGFTDAGGFRLNAWLPWPA